MEGHPWKDSWKKLFIILRQKLLRLTSGYEFPLHNILIALPVTRGGFLMMHVASWDPFPQESCITNMNYNMEGCKICSILPCGIPFTPRFCFLLFQISVAVEYVASTWCHYNLYMLCKPASLLVPGGWVLISGILAQAQHD